jgi:hypothetical protein
VDYALFDRSLVGTVLLEPLTAARLAPMQNFNLCQLRWEMKVSDISRQDVANGRRQVVGARIGLELDERHAAVLIA